MFESTLRNYFLFDDGPHQSINSRFEGRCSQMGTVLNWLKVIKQLLTLCDYIGEPFSYHEELFLSYSQCSHPNLLTFFSPRVGARKVDMRSDFYLNKFHVAV